MIKKVFQLLKKYKELILYIVFGVVTTVTNWAVYAIAVKIMGVDLSSVKVEGNVVYTLFHSTGSKSLMLLFIANIIAWLVAVAVAFVTNKLWVFESKSWKPVTVIKEIGGFISSRLVTGMLEWFGIPALVLAGMNQSLFGIEGFLAKAIVSVIVIIANYVFSKFVVFKNKKST